MEVDVAAEWRRSTRSLSDRYWLSIRRFKTDVGDVLAEALAEGYTVEQDGEYVATARVWETVPGTSRA